MSWKLKRTKQCAKCPWRKDTNPHEIPNGYSVEQHNDLRCTIADPSDPFSTLLSKTAHVMACHEEHDAHCLGWLVNQAGPGHNLGLRLAMVSCENAHEVELVGEQHETFEDTLPTH